MIWTDLRHATHSLFTSPEAIAVPSVLHHGSVRFGGSMGFGDDANACGLASLRSVNSSGVLFCLEYKKKSIRLTAWTARY